LKGVTSYVSEIALLAIAMAGLTLIYNVFTDRTESLKTLTSTLGSELSVSYVCYSGGYVYAYNYGSPFKPEEPVEVLVGETWVNAAIVETGAVFRVRSQDPIAVLPTDKGLLVIKP